ncbi:MAG: SDR family NAD(P)-dependent oxidoreductase [Nocardiopsaceae bacterium]|nr:SDR family NAD(P)-dependent oxidoreductase [Nocardiopsaceae bacterium]
MNGDSAAAATPSRSGRTALVTGAGSGIGRATAHRLAAGGAAVACLDIDAAAAAATAAAIRDRGGAALALTADIADTDAVTEAVAEVVAWGSGLDVLACVAGTVATDHTEHVTPEQWDRIIRINLTGTFRTIQAALPALRRSRGAVVTVGSIAGVAGRPYLAAYSAAKGGIVALTRALAVEYAHSGVRLTCVCPGSVGTSMPSAATPPEDAPPELAERGRSLLPRRRAEPEEIAAMIAHLTGPEAAFTTGSVHVIDGGAIA